MKVIKQKRDTVIFDHLGTGYCFKYDNKIYMVVSTYEKEYYAADLETGLLEKFDGNTEVVIVEVEARYK